MKPSTSSPAPCATPPASLSSTLSTRSVTLPQHPLPVQTDNVSYSRALQQLLHFGHVERTGYPTYLTLKTLTALVCAHDAIDFTCPTKQIVMSRCQDMLQFVAVGFLGCFYWVGICKPVLCSHKVPVNTCTSLALMYDEVLNIIDVNASTALAVSMVCLLRLLFVRPETRLIAV